MDSVFIKVSTKDRLPSDNGLYLTNNGHVHFLSGCKRFMGCDPQWWLEEVELPSDEEIKKEAENHAFTNAFKLGANYILNTLKGENRNA
ncbi:MAG TPA: hypothetical protein DCG77_00505 [Sphingobacterium sp.]|nr:hypothetical protein [Sphingobacterium sp.]